MCDIYGVNNRHTITEAAKREEREGIQRRTQEECECDQMIPIYAMQEERRRYATKKKPKNDEDVGGEGRLKIEESKRYCVSCLSLRRT